MQPSLCSDTRTPTNTKNCKIGSKSHYFLIIDSFGMVDTIRNRSAADGKTRLLFLLFTNLVVLQCKIQNSLRSLLSLVITFSLNLFVGLILGTSKIREKHIASLKCILSDFC